MIKTINFPINNLTLTHEVLAIFINKFWVEVFSPIASDSKQIHLQLIVKVKFTDETLGYRCLAPLRRVNYEDLEAFTWFIQKGLDTLVDSYTTEPVSIMQFSYITNEGVAPEGQLTLSKDLLIEGKKSHIFNNKKLPISMLPSDYGNVLTEVKLPEFTRYIVSDNRKVYQIDITLDGLVNTVKIINSDIEWTDTKINSCETTFKRELGKSTIYFMDGEIVLRKQQRSPKPFKKTSKDKVQNSKFSTFDIETIKLNGKLTPYLICGYNGKDYITAFNRELNQEKLFNSYLDQLLSQNSSKSLIVYAHNLGAFDGVFLLKHLIRYGEVKPLIFNSKIMSITLKIESTKRTVIFRDSYLMLPQSLRKLCKSFNIEMSKGIFPVEFNYVDYIGNVPLFKYFRGITLELYLNYVSTFSNMDLWSFKEQSIKYCKLDCHALYEVLVVFNDLIFKEFNVNITKCVTLPALAMRIYKTALYA